MGVTVTKTATMNAAHMPPHATARFWQAPSLRPSGWSGKTLLRIQESTISRPGIRTVCPTSVEVSKYVEATRGFSRYQRVGQRSGKGYQAKKLATEWFIQQLYRRAIFVAVAMRISIRR